MLIFQFETHDREGNLLRYNKDDDELTLGELVRQEKFGAGSADQKNLDAEMASAIARDGRYQVRERASGAVALQADSAGRSRLHGRKCR